MDITEGTTIASSTELDYGLKSQFLANLNDDERLHVFDLTARTARELHHWAAHYPLIRRVRVWPLSLSVAAAARFCAVSSLVSMARMNLWVFTIDDLFDEEIVPYNELRRRAARYRQILGGERAIPGKERDTLTLALQDIRDDLAHYPLFGDLGGHWANAVSQTIESMTLEHNWRSNYRRPADTQVMPTYEAYIEHGLYSIGGPPHIWTALIAIDDPSTSVHLARLQRMEREASICIRLANDLQSHAKELQEGKINSIIIRQRELAACGISEQVALDHARASAQANIQRGLKSCLELQHLASTTTGYPERAIADIAHFVCDFYVHHDYHTFTISSGRM
jgi:terpene synthase-like protein